VDVEEGLLERVLGVGAPPGEMEREREDRLAERPEELVEGPRPVGGASARPGEDGGLGRGVEREGQAYSLGSRSARARLARGRRTRRS
jgi:hypothetical protein